jgi:hypothetical protein
MASSIAKGLFWSGRRHGIVVASVSCGCCQGGLCQYLYTNHFIDIPSHVFACFYVQTLLQNIDGSADLSSWDISKKMYTKGGIGAFFDGGLTPKML